MKNYTIILVLCIGLLFSCNKPVANYPSTLPWGGIDPFSAIVNGKSVAATIAQYQQLPSDSSLLGTQITEVVNLDTSISRTFTFRLPHGGGETNKSLLLDSTNKAYVLLYRQQLLKGSTLISEKYYTSYNTNKAISMRLSDNSSTLIKGVFHGYLRNVYGGNDYIEVQNGYFSVTK